jgi:hypothetical protein
VAKYQTAQSRICCFGFRAGDMQTFSWRKLSLSGLGDFSGDTIGRVIAEVEAGVRNPGQTGQNFSLTPTQRLCLSG